MSRGYGKTQRDILATMDADPERLFSVRELICGDEYGDVGYTDRKSHERAIRTLWEAGEIWRAHWFFSAEPRRSTRYCHSELAILCAWRDRHAWHVERARNRNDPPPNPKYLRDSERNVAEFEAEIEAFRSRQHLDGLSDANDPTEPLATLRPVSDANVAESLSATLTPIKCCQPSDRVIGNTYAGVEA